MRKILHEAAEALGFGQLVIQPPTVMSQSRAISMGERAAHSEAVRTFVADAAGNYSTYIHDRTLGKIAARPLFGGNTDELEGRVVDQVIAIGCGWPKNYPSRDMEDTISLVSRDVHLFTLACLADMNRIKGIVFKRSLLANIDDINTEAETWKQDYTTQVLQAQGSEPGCIST